MAKAYDTAWVVLSGNLDAYEIEAVFLNEEDAGTWLEENDDNGDLWYESFPIGAPESVSA